MRLVFPYKVGDAIRYTDIGTGDVVHTTVRAIEYGYIGVWDENAERGDWLHVDEVEHDTPPERSPRGDDAESEWFQEAAYYHETLAVEHGFQMDGGF